MRGLTLCSPATHLHGFCSLPNLRGYCIKKILLAKVSQTDFITPLMPFAERQFIKMIENNNLNTSIFFVPIYNKSIEKTIKTLENNEKWSVIEKKELTTNYLLKYVDRLTTDENLFISFKYNVLEKEKVSFQMSEYTDGGTEVVNKKYEEKVSVSDIRVSVFGTGIAFAELQVSYNGLTPDEICDFVYTFKKIYKHDDIDEGKKSFLGIISEALPKDSVPFFYNSVNHGKNAFKNECIGFHTLRFFEDEINDIELKELLFRLRRGYGTRFKYEECQGQYDFEYNPSTFDFWSGSQEGLVNIIRVNEGNIFYDKYKYLQFIRDYRFMYLMLLNQRFSAIRYIEEVATGDFDTIRDVNERIVRLKTVYSFRVVSNDFIYQNLYIRIYRLLDIDNILDDLSENEQQVEMYRAKSHEKAEKQTNKLLIAISFLSVFSFLIDASSYLELFAPFSSISKWISLLTICAIMITWMINWYLNRK